MLLDGPAPPASPQRVLRRRLTRGQLAVACLSVLALSDVTLELQLRGLAGSRYGVGTLEGAHAYLEQEQLRRHQAVLEGSAPNPLRYRLLAEWAAEGMLRAARWAGAERPVVTAFVQLRFLQNLLILALAFWLYRGFGLSWIGALLGISVLAWGMGNAIYDSDLSFNTYFDVLFYLAGGGLVVAGRQAWLPLLVVLAALNRETSVFIPLLAIAVEVERKPRLRLRWERLRPALLSLACYVVVTAAVRLHAGLTPAFVAYGHRIGLDLLAYNLRRITWVQLCATLGALPLAACLGLSAAPETLRRFFWTLVPAWWLLHALASVMAETRLQLVPLAVVLIPLALIAARRAEAPVR